MKNALHNIQLRHTLLVAAAFILLAGCATAPDRQGPPNVFGHLIARRNGEPLKLGPRDCKALILSERDNGGLVLPFDSGWMAWSLNPGGYIFSELQCWGDATGNGRYTESIGMHFKVEPDATQYIGDLGFDFVTDNSSFAKEFLRGLTLNAFGQPKDHFENVTWTSNEAEAAAEFARRYPGAAFPVVQNPTRAYDWGHYRSVTPICEAAWKIACTVDLQGLEPVDPPIDRGHGGVGFTKIDRVDPTLKWKPVADPDITYDVVVREVVQYPFTRNLSQPQVVPGRAVAYAENLTTPEFSLTNRLAPKTWYVWSVRLRRGDQVSSWSLAGHRTYLIVYASSSSGAWFGLETP